MKMELWMLTRLRNQLEKRIKLLSRMIKEDCLRRKLTNWLRRQMSLRRRMKKLGRILRPRTNWRITHIRFGLLWMMRNLNQNSARRIARKFRNPLMIPLNGWSPFHRLRLRNTNQDINPWKTFLIPSCKRFISLTLSNRKANKCHKKDLRLMKLIEFLLYYILLCSC